jgi:hypothetical protein
MILKPTYQEFKDAMDRIGMEIAEASREHKYALLYSGGVDSTAILASLLKSKADIWLVHCRHGKKAEYYYLLLEQFAMHMAMKYGLPLLFLHDMNDSFPNEYKNWKDLGITYFVSGCGMDRMFQECYYDYPEGVTPLTYVPSLEVLPGRDVKVLPFSKGERFRMFHPFLDVLLGSKARVKSIRLPKIPMKDDWVSKWRTEEIENHGLHVFTFDNHPLMMKVMDGYKPGVKDVFNRKGWTFRYVEDFFGKSYRDFCFEVMNSRRVQVELEKQ